MKIGIDLGGSHIAIGVIDDKGYIVEKAEKYDQMRAQLCLMCELAEGRRSGEEEGWISSNDVRNHFKARAHAENN